LRNLHTIFDNGYASYSPTNNACMFHFLQIIAFYFSLKIFFGFVILWIELMSSLMLEVLCGWAILPDLFVISILIKMRCHLMVALICISLTISDFKISSIIYIDIYAHTYLSLSLSLLLFLYTYIYTHIYWLIVRTFANDTIYPHPIQQ
jgi:hypothetical protein